MPARVRGRTDFDSLGAGQLDVGGASLSVGKGTVWYVDATNGADTNSGKRWSQAFRTMAKAFTMVRSGETIRFVGKVREQLTAPVQVFDVTIEGGVTRPRHADAAPTPLGGHSAATWTVPASNPSTTAPLLKLQQQGWRISNFVMAGPSAGPCVMTFRDGGAGDAERDSSHFEALGIRFASGKNGIEDSGGCYNVRIADCDFHDLTDFAIKHTAGAGIAACWRWVIERCRFQDCAKWIDSFNPHEWVIRDNVVTAITTPGVNLSGGGGHSVVVRNAFDIAAASFDPDGGFTPHANDVWSNYLADALESGIPAN